MERSGTGDARRTVCLLPADPITLIYAAYPPAPLLPLRERLASDSNQNPVD